jgi:hypothetical protein
MTISEYEQLLDEAKPKPIVTDYQYQQTFQQAISNAWPRPSDYKYHRRYSISTLSYCPECNGALYRRYDTDEYECMEGHRTSAKDLYRQLYR